MNPNNAAPNEQPIVFSPEKNKHLTLIDLFEAQVVRTPDRIAIELNDVSLTYTQLDEMANNCAKSLISDHHFKPQMVIGLYLNESIDYVIALLAVFKTACIGVYVNPTLCDEALSIAIDLNKCEVIITNNACINSDITQTKSCLLLDKLLQTGANSDTILPTSQDSSNVAFHLTTSGTTGHPKRVALRHYGLAMMISEQIKIFTLTEADRVMQWSGLDRDSSLAETFTSLCSGATFVILDWQEIGSNYSLPLVIKRNKISVVTVPPTALTKYRGEEFASLRLLILAGEVLHKDQVWRFLDFVQCFNAYGLTETSVCATCYPLDSSKKHDDIIPIGPPLNHVNIYVVDESMREVKKGMVGELCISGFGLNLYFSDLDSTATAKFITHPFEDYGILFCSGDRGYKDADDNFVVLGRIHTADKIDIYAVPDHVNYKREYLLNFLRNEGYRPTVNPESGNISLLHEGQQYHIGFMPDDTDYYQLLKGWNWSLETEFEKKIAFQAASETNTEFRLCKIFLTDTQDNITAAIELFQPTIELFCHTFHRIFERFDNSIDCFGKKMRILLQQERTNDQ